MTYPSLEEKKIVVLAEELMEKVMGGYDPSHDALHVYRVRKTAMALARAQPSQPDLLVVELAALFHDVLDKKYNTSGDTTDKFLDPFFRNAASKTGIDLFLDGRAILIMRIIDNVSWTTERKLREDDKITEWHKSCVELHCVQDADRLDAIGAIGVMRCAAFSAAKNRPLHVPEGDDRQGSSAIDHFHDKLLKIKERLKTESGMRMGQERHQFMLQFLSAVDREVDALID
ncbi:hypothetical protein BU17DRAFT_74213 [Hysterangium stoloniferum]|nr:hypothetical protein BU17DRAFT_74213 [Hysterangium stoloniferum]